MTAGTSQAQGQPLLSLRGVNKSFGAVHVLRSVDLDVPAGQVTALVGDNGAGKSTLIKSVAGIHPFESGEMFWEGEEVHIHGPKQANALGIEVVYQDLALCDNLDVVHNMFLGREVKSAITLERDVDGAAGRRHAARPVGADAAVAAPAGLEPVGRPAPDGGDRPGGAVELQARHPRRADRGARRRPDRAGA